MDQVIFSSRETNDEAQAPNYQQKVQSNAQED